jgi:hypothetical protein
MCFNGVAQLPKDSRLRIVDIVANVRPFKEAVGKRPSASEADGFSTVSKGLYEDFS